MKKIFTIKKNKDFHRLYSRGKSFVSPCLVTYVMPNKFGYLRIGITTSKKVGNAVKRNRSRRVIREAFYQIQITKEKSFDIVFVARGRTSKVKTPDIFKVMKEHMTKANLI